MIKIYDECKNTIVNHKCSECTEFYSCNVCDLIEETKDKEIDFITAIAIVMILNNKIRYTNTYEFSNGDKFKIEIQKLI